MDRDINSIAPKKSEKKLNKEFDIRDRLAVAALASLEEEVYTSNEWAEDMAKAAYKIADAMMEEREKW